MRLLKFLFSRFFICIFLIAALTVAIVFLCLYVHSLLPAAAAIALAYTLAVIAVLCLLFSESPSEFKCGWFTLIVALPVGGAMLYFLSYLSRCQRRERAQPFTPTECRSYEYFSDGAQFLSRLISVVSTAKRQILLEFYIFAKGKIWAELYRELMRALERGVEVKIIYDGLGSALRKPSADFRALKKAGAQIKVFNKLLPLPVSRLNFRDHRKIAAIDGEAVFLGGVNIADEYANLSSPHGHWKDGGGVFYGQIAEVFTQIFLTSFNGGETPAENGAENGNEAGAMPILPIADDPARTGSVCEDSLAAALYSAQKRVYIFTPYLCMGDKLHDAILFAKRRGADVKILVPHIPDKKLTYSITLCYCDRLAAEGVEVYTYTPGFMHFKGVVCDDEALLGSYNFDFRSMRLNYECGVWGGQKLAEDMSRDFLACITLGGKYHAKKRNAVARAASSLLCLFAPLV